MVTDPLDRPALAVRRCCDLHNSNCEPPSELCCWECSEAAHPEHPSGIGCTWVIGPWPSWLRDLHAADCQMLRRPPEGFPFDTFSCNCRTADLGSAGE